MQFYEKILNTPKKIMNDIETLNFLCDFFYLSNQHAQTIVINFKETIFFRYNLSSVFGAICWNASKNNNKIKFRNVSNNIKNILSTNKFLKKFGINEIEDQEHITISYMEFLPEERISFSEYIKNEFLPSLTTVLKNEFKQEFRISIEELFQNCRLHGECDKIFTCGHFFVNENKIYFTISNIGISIKENVNKHLDDYSINSIDAIVWATKEGNTTRKEKNIGGIGLHNLIKFLDDTNGKIQIVSNDGVYERENKQELYQKLNKSFDGTIVTLIFNLKEIDKYRKDFFDSVEIVENFF